MDTGGSYFVYSRGGWTDTSGANFAHSSDYYVYGHDNSYGTGLACALVSMQSLIAAVLLALNCFRCCSHQSPHLAARSLAAIGRVVWGIGYGFASLHHLRLATANLEDTSYEAILLLDAAKYAPIGNFCFWGSDLRWAARAFAMADVAKCAGTGLVLAACHWLLLRRRRRASLAWMLASTLACVSLAIAASLTNTHATLRRTAQSLLLSLGTVLAACLCLPELPPPRAPIFPLCCGGSERVGDEAAVSSAAGVAPPRAAREAWRVPRQAQAVTAAMIAAKAGAAKAGASQRASVALWSMQGVRLLLLAGVMHGLAMSLNLILFDGANLLSTNCATPCPDDCPLPASFNHNAAATVVHALGWMLWDAAMLILVPTLVESEYALVAPHATPEKELRLQQPPTELAEATPMSDFKERGDSEASGEEGSEGDDSEDEGVVEDDLDEEDVSGEEGGAESAADEPSAP